LLLADNDPYPHPTFFHVNNLSGRVLDLGLDSFI